MASATTHGLRAGRAFVEIGAIDATGTILNRIRNRLGRWGSEVTALGTTIALRSAAAMTPIAASIREFSSFDDIMRRVEARSEGTSEQMLVLRETAKQLSIEFGFSAAQIGAAMESLATKGFSREDIKNMTQPILNLAKSGAGVDLALDTATAADAVAGTLRAFAMDASEAARVADLLAMTVDASNFTLSELVTTLSYAAPVAAAYGVSLEEVLAITAAMRDLNIDASIAGTATRNIIMYASKSMERSKFNERLAKLTGTTIDFIDATGNLQSPLKYLQAIFKATEKLGTAERGELFDMLFETRATVPATAVGKSANTLAMMMAKLSTSMGQADKKRQLMEKGIGGALRRAFATVSLAAIEFGGAISNLVAGAMDYIGVKLIQPFTEWVKTNSKVAVSLVALIALTSMLGLTLIVIGQAIRIVTAILTPFILLFKAMGLVVGAANLLAAAIATLLSPMGLLVLSIGLITVSLFGAAGGFTYARDAIARLIETSKVFTNLWKTAAGTIVESLRTGNIQGAVEVLGATIEISWLELIEKLKSHWRAFTNWLAESFYTLNDNVRSVLEKLAYGFVPFGDTEAWEETRRTLEGMRAERVESRALSIQRGMQQENELKRMAKETLQQKREALDKLMADIWLENFMKEFEEAGREEEIARLSKEMKETAAKTMAELAKAAAGIIKPSKLAPPIPPGSITGIDVRMKEAADAFQQAKFNELRATIASELEVAKASDEKLAEIRDSIRDLCSDIESL